MRNIHLTFDYSTYSQKSGEDFAKLCGLLRIYELYRRPIEDPLPRTIENVRIRATIQRTINQVSALVGALSRPTTSRAPRGAAAAATSRRKRKSTTRKPASGSSAKKRKTSTKRKSVKRKKSTRAPGQPKVV